MSKPARVSNVAPARPRGTRTRSPSIVEGLAARYQAVALFASSLGSTTTSSSPENALTSAAFVALIWRTHFFAITSSAAGTVRNWGQVDGCLLVEALFAAA